MRARLSSTRALLVATLVAVVLPACAAPGDDGAATAAPIAEVRAGLTVDGPAFAADERPVVTVTLTNTGTTPERFLSWYVTEDELAAPLLSVTRDGAPVGYRGPLVKRVAPGADDYVVLAPGASLTRRIDLSAMYDLSQTGDYTVTMAVPLATLRGEPAADAHLVRANDLGVWIEGRHAVIEAAPKGAPSKGSSCTSDELAQLSQALGVAGTLSNGASAYLQGTTPSGTPRYTTWFGAFSSAGWSKASGDFAALASTFATQTFTFDCKCKQKNVYAFVQPDQPYNVNLCGAFWPAPMSGTDSKGGTLVHETSHFTVVAGTNDWAYGQTACQSLAVSDPTKALDNADSHEYFAENNPALQ
jgi:peptidyl-Lys metalloendopeptidase